MDQQTFRSILLLFCVLEVFCDEPEVEILQGRLRGGTRTNMDGGTYYSFQNIPYGRPPLGELRFKAPEPAEGWEGTRDATHDLPSCVQISTGNGIFEGQEDCLYLNVYTPELPGESTSKKAVMVWIYGGAFIRGSAEESEFGAQFLLSKDVVLVIMNYRMSMFGYLSLDNSDLGVPGNAGSKDQVLALKWVQNNIEYFGGDPDNVLLFGQSAGGMSADLHLLSPMSKGLFHKAIFQSHTALFYDFTDNRVRNTGVLLAEAMGIQTENWEEMLESLRSAEIEDIAVAATELFNSIKYFSSPIVEIASSEPAFFPDEPLILVRSGDYNKDIPIMTGFCDVEGLMRASSALLSGSTYPITNFVPFIPEELQIEAGSEAEEDIVSRLRKFYYGDAEVTDNVTSGITMYSDYENNPSYRTILEYLKAEQDIVYVYYFTADTSLNPSKQGNNITYPGAAHGDDVAYLFTSSNTPEYEEGSNEDRAIRTMVNLWTNFAIYNNPTPEGFQDYSWQPVQLDHFHYIHIDTEETTIEDGYPTPEAFEFWSDLYAEYFPYN